VADQGLPRVRQAHAAGASLDELGPALPLEGGDVLADGGLGEAEGLGGGGEGAAGRDLAKHLHAANVEH
jgi:hypothetical protein